MGWVRQYTRSKFEGGVTERTPHTHRSIQDPPDDRARGWAPTGGAGLKGLVHVCSPPVNGRARSCLRQEAVSSELGRPIAYLVPRLMWSGTKLKEWSLTHNRHVRILQVAAWLGQAFLFWESPGACHHHHPAVRRVPRAQLHHPEEQAQRPGSAGAAQVLPPLPPPHRPSRNQVGGQGR